jgi:hypothetical protein
MCTNQLNEFNMSRPCWLPVNPTSPFQLCTRCDFYKVEEVLKDPSSHSEILHSTSFCLLCLMPNHRNSLLNALVNLHEKRFSLFVEFMKSLATEEFQNNLNHQIYTHFPSNRCSFYQYILKTRQLDRKEFYYTDIPLNCWPCLAFIHRQKECLWLDRALTRAILSNKLSCPERSKDSILDVMTSMTVQGKAHRARLIFERFRSSLKNEQKAQTALIEFLTQPAFISSLFLEASIDFVPYTWKDKLTTNYLQKEGLKAVRKRNWVFKEDLMIKTWHPDRLFSWCFDIEELKDFA